jgi:arylsulfatase A-like enzyme
MGESCPADGPGPDAGAGPTPPTGASDLLLLSAWVGLAAGWIEVGTRVFLKNVLGPGHMYLMMRHFFWAVPLANLLMFLAAGLIIGAAARRWPRSSRWLGRRMLLTAAILPPMLVAGRQIYPGAWLLLAAGIAVRAMPRLERSRIDWRWWGCRTLPALLGPVPVVAGIIVGADWLAVARLAAGPMPPAGAPDVLLIILDTVRADRLSLYGYGRPTSPVLERLATLGIRFDEARSSAPWTLPSHASFFTGRWPHELGVGWQAPLRTPSPTLAEYLASRGYETAGFVANARYCSYDAGLDRGFAHYEDYAFDLAHLRPLRTSILGEFAWNAATWAGRSSGLSRDNPVLRWLQAHDRKDAGAINDGFLGWLDRRGDRRRPYFAFLNYYDAHAPYLPPEGTPIRFGPGPRSVLDFFVLVERWNEIDKLHLGQNFADLILDSYENCLAYLDGRLGRLFVELGRRGAMDRTLVVIAADHGEELGDHELFEHGESLYRPEIRVPLLILLPSGRHAGSVVRETVSLRDLPATIVDLAGLADGSPFPGRSLARFWRDRRPGHRDDDADDAFSELPAPNPAFPSLGRSPAAKGPLVSLARDNYVYIRDEGDGREHLYDESADPRELTDLSGDAWAQPVLRRLRERLDRIAGGRPR